ncbi:ABC transporter ATP-binding protein [Bacillus changyiensis]|uniref:ABC transporter ATP-binding protein n=1 Tax=Bacillus changyiensis TaxID=3004103 RepID=UPI0022E833B0|nr:ABC transporter ATP-binding protein [Bacillus changyiensis]MDA1477175.1 ABC transporter ATP-binding protein [Bacillus changyiensis]
MSMILATNQIAKSFGEGASLFYAVHPASIAIEKGSINVIMGKSGSGKSTLLSMLGGMEQPTKGQLLFQQQNFYQLHDAAQAEIRGQHFGFVFQAYHLIPELSVFDNIILPLVMNKKKFNMSYIRELAEHLGIEQKLTAFPYQLSGGQQQRTAIARAMANDPEIIFADEPTGNLDTKNSQNVMDLLVKLCKEKHRTLVVVTHDENLVEEPDQLFLIEDGVLKTR